MIAAPDELASAAELVMHKLDRVPVAIVRGYRFDPLPPGDEAGAAALVREPQSDMFR